MAAPELLPRRRAVAAVLDELGDGVRVVMANGYISRDGFACREEPLDFYMLGSMGLAGAIALGVAVAAPETRLAVLDGDGNLLMGFGVLPMIGAWQPRRFLHVVLDNGTYGSTGGQPTLAGAVDFAAAALSCGYRRAASVQAEDELRERVRAWCGEEGPSLLHVRIDPQEPGGSPRVDIEPLEIARRFAAAVVEAED